MLNFQSEVQAVLNEAAMRDHAAEMVQPVLQEFPSTSGPIKIADGIWWLRFSLNGMQDHVNGYVLDDHEGWTIVDCGSNTPQCISTLESLLQLTEFESKPIKQVICTHYHPDHIGLAGWLAGKGAKLLTTRTSWLSARLLHMDHREVPTAEQVEFLQRAGLPAMELAAYRRRRPSTYSDLVCEVPRSYQRIQEGDSIKIGNRIWTIHVGHGHASEHATLWSQDAIAIVGDQILPSISPNLSVHPSEPAADLVTEWIKSCRRMAALASVNTMALPGHGTPFIGVRKRCEQLIDNVNLLLDRLLEFVTTPSTAVACLSAVYRRELRSGERETMIAETMGLLNHLMYQGKVRRDLVGQTYLWSRTPHPKTTLRVDLADANHEHHTKHGHSLPR